MEPNKLYELFKLFKSSLQQRTEYLTEDSLRYYFFACMYKRDNNLDHYIMELPYASLEGEDNKQYKIFITEDDAKSLLTKDKAKINHHNPHQELDLYYYNGKNELICIEFKFHRNPQNTTQAYPNNAGRIMNDIRRLKLIKPKKDLSIRRLFVYVTDDDMHEYFTSISGQKKYRGYRKDLQSFYKGDTNKTVFEEFVMNDGKYELNNGNKEYRCPKTFFNSANDSFSEHAETIEIETNKVFDSTFNTKCNSFQGDNHTCHILIYEVI